MTWSELHDLVTALPEDSATKAAYAGDENGMRWAQGTYLQAMTANLLQLIAQTLWRAHLKGEPPEMTPIQPPKLTADETRDELSEAKAARNKAVLDSLAPHQAPADAARQKAEIDQWLARIRELEAAKAQQERQEQQEEGRAVDE